MQAYTKNKAREEANQVLTEKLHEIGLIQIIEQEAVKGKYEVSIKDYTSFSEKCKEFDSYLYQLGFYISFKKDSNEMIINW